ncbi:MAG: type II secretion system protein M [Elusimicrobia bacterium]|nr:type II secretion system protein M [Elusimicrobiota bacterium]
MSALTTFRNQLNAAPGKTAAFLALGLAVALALPVSREAGRLRAAAAADDVRLARMRASGGEILSLRGQGVTGPAETAPLGAVDGSIDGAGLRSFVQSVTQNDADGVTVAFERAPFSRVAWWINDLRKRRGLRVERATLQQVEAGMVDVQVQLR